MPDPFSLRGAALPRGAGHFRAHGRRRVRLVVTLRGEHAGWERSGRIIDIHVAGAGVETDEPLLPRERVSLAFETPTRWDPLVLPAVVAWAHPIRHTDEIDALGRPRASARSGVAFDYPSPDAALALFEMLLATELEYP